jgi:undecaprenyl-phosphate 4-deoxy-4-formamido-L-arabinose transferase
VQTQPDQKPEESRGHFQNLPHGPYLSVVVPVFNEADNIPILHQRLIDSLQALKRPFEVIYVDDGSQDASLGVLTVLTDRDPRVKIVELTRNYGQHAAILAGFDQTRGTIVVTLDADLQNPPEEIGKLVTTIEEGADIASGVRTVRYDSLFRKMSSKVINGIIGRATGIRGRDCGCMLSAYRREVVNNVCRYAENATFIPALASLFTRSIREVPVTHAKRASGKSKYDSWRLVKLAFNLLVGFSLFPIQLISIMGLIVVLLGIVFSVLVFVRWQTVGSESLWVHALLALSLVFAGLQILALGIVGEYIGRIYREVCGRPRYLIRRVYHRGEAVDSNSAMVVRSSGADERYPRPTELQKGT